MVLQLPEQQLRAHALWYGLRSKRREAFLSISGSLWRTHHLADIWRRCHAATWLSWITLIQSCYHKIVAKVKTESQTKLLHQDCIFYTFCTCFNFCVLNSNNQSKQEQQTAFTDKVHATLFHDDISFQKQSRSTYSLNTLKVIQCTH